MLEKGHVHFIGMGGIGMLGVATLALAQGWQVSGSDHQTGSLLQTLQDKGATVYAGHTREHLASTVQVVVVSSAITQDNVEWQEAQKRGCLVYHRAHFLAELIGTQKVLAVSGCHGKTTVSGMLVSALRALGIATSYVLGGVLQETGTMASWEADAAYCVIEADESDGSFVHYRPFGIIMTNFDVDHVQGPEEVYALERSYYSFMRLLDPRGVGIYNADDPILKRLVAPLWQHWYGVTTHPQEESEMLAIQLQDHAALHVSKETKVFQYPLHVQGHHNQRNAATVLALIEALGHTPIPSMFSAFRGMGRRLEYVGTRTWARQTYHVIDDYGHHPVEVQACVQTLRQAWPQQRLIWVYQPHRYSRTRLHWEAFQVAFEGVDKLILLKEYAAGEAFDAQASAQALAHRVQGNSDVFYAPDAEAVIAYIAQHVQDGDVVVLQGAGNITTLRHQLPREEACQ